MPLEISGETFVSTPVQIMQKRENGSSAKQKLAKKPSDWFGHFSSQASYCMGSRWGFAGAILVIAVWAITGPIYHYSDAWQLVINTGTTIVTFLMVFLIQNTQNRDARAINLKLDELIHAISTARNQMIDIEKLSDEELEVLSERYGNIRAEFLKRNPPKSA